MNNPFTLYEREVMSALYKSLNYCEEYDLPTAEAQVRDLDAIVEKLNTTFQQELKDEVEAENFFLN